MPKLKQITAAFAVTILITTMLTTQVFATTVDGDVAGDNNAGSGAILPDTSLIDDNDGAWEVSFYDHDRFRGAFLIGDPAIMSAASGGSDAVQQSTKWHFSNGVRLSDGDSGATGLVTDTAPVAVPRYGATSAVYGWGTDPDVMEKLILENIVAASDKSMGNMSVSEAQEIVQMIRDAKTATPEETKAKVDSGEWFPFFVSMRPVEAKKPRRILLPSWS